MIPAYQLIGWRTAPPPVATTCWDFEDNSCNALLCEKIVQAVTLLSNEYTIKKIPIALDIEVISDEDTAIRTN